jgi:hypothetical protein
MAEIDTKIDQLTRMRQTLVAVMAADCDSLTDCSCGWAVHCPSWRSPDPQAATATTTDPAPTRRPEPTGRLAGLGVGCGGRQRSARPSGPAGRRLVPGQGGRDHGYDPDEPRPTNPRRAGRSRGDRGQQGGGPPTGRRGPSTGHPEVIEELYGPELAGAGWGRPGAGSRRSGPASPMCAWRSWS